MICVFMIYFQVIFGNVAWHQQDSYLSSLDGVSVSGLEKKIVSCNGPKIK